MPRVLPCVAASAIENGGFTDAMGDFESQVCERSMTRALAIAASKVCARESSAKAEVVPQATLNTTTAARQRTPDSAMVSIGSGLNMSSSLRQIMQSPGKASQGKQVPCLPLIRRARRGKIRPTGGQMRSLKFLSGAFALALAFSAGITRAEPVKI